MKARSLDIWLRCGHKAMTILTGGAIAAFTISSTAVTFNAIGLDFPLVGFNVGVMAASSGLAVLFWNFATSIYDYRLERIGKLHNEKCSQAK